MAVLLIDFRAGRQAFFLSGAGRLKRLSALPQRGGFSLLSRAIRNWHLRREPPQAIGVATVPGALRPTWSALRGVAAMANTLALAWNVPLFMVGLSGNEDAALMEEKTAAAIGSGRAANWFRPDYGGEPHITQPKNRPV